MTAPTKDEVLVTIIDALNVARVRLARDQYGRQGMKDRDYDTLCVYLLEKARRDLHSGTDPQEVLDSIGLGLVEIMEHLDI